MYEKSLEALKNSSRFRERKLFDENLIDFASNDYLGLSENKKLLKKAYKKVKKYKNFAPKASLLVNGYHPIHKEFEEKLCRLNGFESGIVAGSGFLANLALFEALPRKGDLLLMDEEFHASGIVASKLTQAKVLTFRHNDYKNAKELMESNSYKNLFIAVEGVYSMGGDLVKKEFFELADEKNAVLVVDEAHSCGVLGENLLGIFEYYGITPKANHIKMGTLGKALGSYGAYILANKETVSFLENRAKSIIYATAPSLFDIALASVNLTYITKKAQKFHDLYLKAIEIAHKETGIKTESLILPIPMKSSKSVLDAQEKLAKEGFVVGAIRPPTVKIPILRVILRLNELENLEKALKIIKNI
ncbi:MAG: 8-amino-7-oxononanoate synthase [Campylobacterota bacterium]|nr:8-amino-7-oxononanoate synthase [Campylobacterota bacterium]